MWKQRRRTGEVTGPAIVTRQIRDLVGCGVRTTVMPAGRMLLPRHFMPGVCVISAMYFRPTMCFGSTMRGVIVAGAAVGDAGVRRCVRTERHSHRPVALQGEPQRDKKNHGGFPAIHLLKYSPNNSTWPDLLQSAPGPEGSAGVAALQAPGLHLNRVRFRRAVAVMPSAVARSPRAVAATAASAPARFPRIGQSGRSSP
jgi:hypothetical protein